MKEYLRRKIDSIIYKIEHCYYQLDLFRRKQIKQYLNNNSVAKLHIGCGKNIIAGWLNTDISIKRCKEGALYLDAGDRFPFPDNSFDYVYSEHLFEHLNYPQAVNMLSECHRILKHSGVIRISTPNFRFLVDLYLNPEKPINKAYICWSANGGGGGKTIPESSIFVINKFHTTWGHKIIYDAETLSNLMRENGFKDICHCEISKSKNTELINIEGHFKYIPFDYCKLETMILEAYNDKS